VNHTLQFLLEHGYAVLFISVFVEQIGLPVPALPILLAMGALAGSEQISYATAMGVVVLASLIADNVWYWLGVYRGASILNLLCKISLEPDSCVRSTENMFLKYGARSLLFAKFVPGLSTAACPLAGMFRMEVWKFCLFDGMGAVLWAGAYSSVGFLFKDQLEDLADRAAGAGSWVLAVVGFALFAWILWKYLQRRKVYRELRVSRITPAEVFAIMSSGQEPTIVDMRSARAWEGPDASRIPGALHASVEELEERLRSIPRERDVILYCT
jgi:membrane protein DedA with SNARE-associated domain